MLAIVIIEHFIYLSIPVMHRAQTEHCRAWGAAMVQKNKQEVKVI